MSLKALKTYSYTELEIDPATLEEIVITIKRCAKVTAGGKKLSFFALVVVGNRNGYVGFGQGKANEVPFAVQKAIAKAKNNLIKVKLAKNGTIPHTVEGKFDASKILIKPAGPGTGIIAGDTVRAVLELAGIKNALSKAQNSTNPINLIKATFIALSKLRTKSEIMALRGVRD
jgi:small subunit ribosomal protein S5